MDYKEKYTREEALREVRGFMGQLTEGCQAAIESLIPELAESEDERIRKEIIGYLTHRADVTAFVDETKDCERWIAYLEKQKEQKPQGVYVDCTEHPEWYGMLPKEQKPAEWGEEDETSIAVKNPEAYKIGFEDGEAYAREELKQEWSEEDERMLSRCIKSIETSKQFADSNTFTIAKDKEIEWLKSLPERFNLQPKQEWSEEDSEECKRSIIWYLEAARNPKDTYGLGEIDQDIAWLKSLRPSWKPSEEQIYSLGTVVNGIGESAFGISKNLRDLYEQLKKMI